MKIKEIRAKLGCREVFLPHTCIYMYIYICLLLYTKIVAAMLSSSDIIKTASFDIVLIPLVVRLLYLRRLGHVLLLTNFYKIDIYVKLMPLLIPWLTPVKGVPRSVFCVVVACTLLVAYQVFLLLSGLAPNHTMAS